MQTNKKSIESDFIFAKTKTAVTIMNATGWNQGVVNPTLLSENSVFFYVFDYKTKWTWCCSIPKNNFYEVIGKSKSINQNDSVIYCGQIIKESALKDVLDPEIENNLAIALTAYISKTKTYQLTEDAKKANHFVVIHYGSTNTIRPFAMGGPPSNLIPLEEIQESIKNVIVMDSRNHPDWIE